MFAVDGMIGARRARVLIIARSKATAMLFRTSYHEHTGASAFDRLIDGTHDNIVMGLVLIFRKVSRREAAHLPLRGEPWTQADQSSS